MPRFELDESEEKILMKRLSVECASDGASAIPRVVEEIKWRSTEASNISILDRIGDFIEQPVEEVVRQLRAESNIENSFKRRRLTRGT